MSWQFKQKRLNCLESIIILVNAFLSKNVPLPIVLSRMISVFFCNSIILLTCVKWVKTLKWQQHLEETWEMTVEPHWDKEALNPLQCAQPSPAPGHSSPTAESVGTVSLMDTALCYVALWMTPLRGVHVGLPHLSLSPNMWFSRQSCTGCPSETSCPSSASVRFGRMETVALTLSNNFMAGPRSKGTQLAPCCERWTVL